MNHTNTAKTFMFQFYRDTSIRTPGLFMSGTDCIEDTGLITQEEAEALWGKHYKTILKDIEEGQQSQMCIWHNCDSPTDYSLVFKEIDGRDDLEVKNGKIYRIDRIAL